MKKRYIGGNWLRGFYEGEFETIEEAWSYLSRRFLLAYPTEKGGGRAFYMKVMEENKYGIEQLTICKEGVTEINDLPREEVLERCKHSIHTGL